MKKILALLMAVCMMLALLTGCGSAPAETPQTPAEQPVAEKPAEKEPVALGRSGRAGADGKALQRFCRCAPGKGIRV